VVNAMSEKLDAWAEAEDSGDCNERDERGEGHLLSPQRGNRKTFKIPQFPF
jgi:hypothetical protein